jgi:hypothetical protein
MKVLAILRSYTLALARVPCTLLPAHPAPGNLDPSSSTRGGRIRIQNTSDDSDAVCHACLVWTAAIVGYFRVRCRGSRLGDQGVEVHGLWSTIRLVYHGFGSAIETWLQTKPDIDITCRDDLNPHHSNAWPPTAAYARAVTPQIIH